MPSVPFTPHSLVVCLIVVLPAPILAQEKGKEPHRIVIGKNVTLEMVGQERRVIVEARVCLREGMLEHLVCRKMTKEHEAILAADVDARHIHLALVAARAEPGRPAKLTGKIEPATGTRINIQLQFAKDGKQITIPARQWVRTIKGKQDMEGDWVFAGSRLIEVEANKPLFYAANEGDVICVANFESALLDLDRRSSSSGDDLLFEANTNRIPPVGTPVRVILTPMEKGK